MSHSDETFRTVKEIKGIEYEVTAIKKDSTLRIEVENLQNAQYWCGNWTSQGNLTCNPKFHKIISMSTQSHFH